MNLFAEAKTLLLKHWDLKLIALALAVILRLVIVGDKDVERLIPNVQLEFLNLPPGIEIATPIRSRFDVLLLTPSGKQVQGSDIAVIVDMKNTRLGSNVISLGPSSVMAPEGVEALRVKPSRLVVHLEKTLQKKVKVNPVSKGTVAPGYEIYEIQTDPAEVFISGPTSQVQLLEGVSTEPVRIEGLSQSFNVVVNVMDDLAPVRVEQLDPIMVTFKIRKKL